VRANGVKPAVLHRSKLRLEQFSIVIAGSHTRIVAGAIIAT
jgi:hypothetical protein